ncbi:MAG: hypothetical protein KJ737_01915, partial [Proteobacteria bacterium]|nr:hypothetical protein [Pseudomonadota bacterium]
QVVEDVLEKKTPHESDEWYVVPDSSHIDIVGGLNAPLFSFPKIGTWLDKVCNGIPDVSDEETVDEVIEDETGNTTVDSLATGDNEESVDEEDASSQKTAKGKSYCFISAIGQDGRMAYGLLMMAMIPSSAFFLNGFARKNS